MGWICVAEGWHVYEHPSQPPTVPDQNKTKGGVFSFHIDSIAKQHRSVYWGDIKARKRENGSVQLIFLMHFHGTFLLSSARCFFTGHSVPLQRSFCVSFLPTLLFMSWPRLNGIIYPKWHLSVGWKIMCDVIGNDVYKEKRGTFSCSYSLLRISRIFRVNRLVPSAGWPDCTDCWKLHANIARSHYRLFLLTTVIITNIMFQGWVLGCIGSVTFSSHVFCRLKILSKHGKPYPGVFLQWRGFAWAFFTFGFSEAHIQPTSLIRAT